MVRLAIALLVLATVAAPLASGAGSQPLPTASSISQYVEQVPAATGPVAVGHGSGTVATLSPAAKTALASRGGSDTTALGRIATDPRYGAPAPVVKPAATAAAGGASSNPSTSHAGTAKPSGGTGTAAAAGSEAGTPAEATPGALSAAGSTLGSDLPWVLMIALGLIAVASVAVARRPS